jgi:hypothetical protein
MYTNNRDAYRETFFNTWQKYQKKIILTALETELIAVILTHPEYHSLLNQATGSKEQEFALEENPFFHMSLHLTIREQIKTNRPSGIAAIHQQLLVNHANSHDAEHEMMKQLAQVMWEAQQSGIPANEEDYLKKLLEK